MKFSSLAIPLLFALPVTAREAVDDARPAPATSEERNVLVKAISAVPNKDQLAWQKLWVYAFIHFGVNTFTDREWGTGKEDPALFNPSDLDCRQWVDTLKAAGCSMVMMTVKHHDGFCLFPSRYTRHSVASSPWKDGKGDVFRELTVACAAAGLKVGVYLSPADLYQIESKGGLYGNKSAAVDSVIPTPVEGRPFSAGHRQFNYKVDDYNRYFLNQLYELLTEYGPISEVWFDGANPKRGTGQEYNRAAWYGMIRELAPQAMIAIDGPDVRWIGNEHGHARENEWSVVPMIGADQMGHDLGSRATIYKATHRLAWYPGEADVSIRPGWFYHASQDQQVRNSQNLFNLYLASVGRNATFLLNVPPDRRGRLADPDVKSLIGFGQALGNTFGNQACGLWNDGKPNPANLAVSAPSALLDNRCDTVWTPSSESWAFEFSARAPSKFLMLEEDIATGQRIERFTLSREHQGNWNEIASGGTVGARRILTIPEIAPETRLRLEIKASRALPRLTEIGLFTSTLFFGEVSIKRSTEGKLVLSSPASVGGEIRYTLDGTEPKLDSPLYGSPITIDKEHVIRAVLIHRGMMGPVTTKLIGLSKSAWKVISASSEESDTPASAAIDEDINTIWHSSWRKEKTPAPHELVIDLGATTTSYGFTYLPRQDAGRGRCCADEYKIYISNDPQKFEKPVAEGRFDNIANNPIEQIVRFSQAVTGRYLKFVILKTADGKPEVTAAEIGLQGK